MSSIGKNAGEVIAKIGIAFAAAALCLHYDMCVQMQREAQEILNTPPQKGQKIPVTLHAFRKIPVNIVATVEQDREGNCVTFTHESFPVEGTTCHRRNLGKLAFLAL